jgi:hypothetical protein
MAAALLLSSLMALKAFSPYKFLLASALPSISPGKSSKVNGSLIFYSDLAVISSIKAAAYSTLASPISLIMASLLSLTSLSVK